MSEPVYRALKRVLKNRGKKPTITVDDYTNFLFLKEDGTPRVGINYNSMIKGLVKKYNKQHKEPLPNLFIIDLIPCNYENEKRIKYQ